MSFQSFVDIYLTDLEPRIKRNTFLTKKHIIETKILPYFGKRKLDDIRTSDVIQWQNEIMKLEKDNGELFSQTYAFEMLYWTGIREGDDDDKIRLNQRKPSKYKGLRRFGPEKNLQRINKFMKERPIFYKNLIQMKENIRFYLRCFYCITKVMILQFNSENRTELARNG